MKRTLILSLFALLLTSGCSNFKMEDLAKTDIDLATEQHMQQMDEHLKTLLTKLYKRNPIQLTHAPQKHSIETRIDQIFNTAGHLRFEELNHIEEFDAMYLAFDPAFEGDRVFALMVGLTGMMRKSWNYKEKIFFTENIDPDKLYKSARNIEIMAWKLKKERHESGKPFLYTHHTDEGIENLSFERLYGKMIGQQDILARVIADRESRTINFMIKQGASLFLTF